MDSNIVGFMNILEGCRHNRVGHLVYASSSSVYGGNTKMPFSEHDSVDHPVSLYAAKGQRTDGPPTATSTACPRRGLRFYRVWSLGPPGHGAFPVHSGHPRRATIDVFNYGKMQRDFTYIDDIVEGVIRVTDRSAEANPAMFGRGRSGQQQRPLSGLQHRQPQPGALLDFIGAIEEALGTTAEKNLLPCRTATSRQPTPTPNCCRSGWVLRRRRRSRRASAVSSPGIAITTRSEAPLCAASSRRQLETISSPSSSRV